MEKSAPTNELARNNELSQRNEDQQLYSGCIGRFRSGSLKDQVAIIIDPAGPSRWNLVTMTSDPGFSKLDGVVLNNENFYAPTHRLVESPERREIFNHHSVSFEKRRRWMYLLHLCTWSFFQILARNLRMPGVDFSYPEYLEDIVKERMGNQFLRVFFNKQGSLHYALPGPLDPAVQAEAPQIGAGQIVRTDEPEVVEGEIVDED